MKDLKFSFSRTKKLNLNSSYPIVTQVNPYRAYPSRWGVLATVFCLNLANNALWISFSSIATTAAEYYENTVSDVDWLGTIGFIVGIPMCLLSTWIVDRFGLRSAIFIGTILTFFGGLVRALGSIESIEKNTQFWISLVGQALTGMGNPMAVSVPTKVSQHWFSEGQRTFATIVLAMSLPLGIVLGQGLTPLFVDQPKDIKMMNIIWFIPAALTQIMFLFCVRTSKPPTPPNKSAEVDQESIPYITRMKMLIFNRNYIFINIAIGGAVGFFNCFATQLQQFMCSRGYSDEFSGLCGSMLLGTGFIGSIFTGTIVQKTGKMEEVAKICYGLAALCGIAATQFLRKSNSEIGIALSCAAFGVFGFGMYPIGLELSVENSYPVDEAAGTALIFLSGQIQGAILISISGALEEDLINPEISKCAENGKNHTRFLMFISGYIVLLTIAFIVGLKSNYKRTEANKKSTDVEISK